MQFEGNLWVAVAVLFLGELVLTSIALAASTRLGQVLTLVTTIGFFLLGLLSDWLIARRIIRIEEIEAAVTEAGGQVGTELALQSWLLEVAYAIVPNFQVFWLADAITQDADIPLDYLAWTVPYGLVLIVVALSIAVMLFQRREVG